MFPHAQVHSREINDAINFGGDNGSDTGEAGSSSQIASIRHVLRRVNMFLFLSLYFCMYAYVCVYGCMCMYMLSTCLSCIDASLLLSIGSKKSILSTVSKQASY